MDSVEDYYRRLVQVSFTSTTAIDYPNMKGFILQVGLDDTFNPATVTLTCLDSLGNTYNIVHSNFSTLNPMMFETNLATGLNYLEENNSAAFINASFYPLNLVNINATYPGDPAGPCIAYLLF
jgi:hypothetical protein